MLCNRTCNNVGNVPLCRSAMASKYGTPGTAFPTVRLSLLELYETDFQTLTCISHKIFNHGATETRRKGLAEKIPLLSENRLSEFYFPIRFFSAFIDYSSLCLRVSVVRNPGLGSRSLGFWKSQGSFSRIVQIQL